MASIGFLKACKDNLCISGETTAQFAAELKKLSQKDKEDLHAAFLAAGMQVDPPAPAKVAS